MPRITPHASAWVRVSDPEGRPVSASRRSAYGDVARCERADHGHRHRPWKWEILVHQIQASGNKSGRSPSLAGAKRAADSVLRAAGWQLDPEPVEATPDDVRALLWAAERL